MVVPIPCVRSARSNAMKACAPPPLSPMTAETSWATVSLHGAVVDKADAATLFAGAAGDLSLSLSSVPLCLSLYLTYPSSVSLVNPCSYLSLRFASGLSVSPSLNESLLSVVCVFASQHCSGTLHMIALPATRHNGPGPPPFWMTDGLMTPSSHLSRAEAVLCRAPHPLSNWLLTAC